MEKMIKLTSATLLLLLIMNASVFSQTENNCVSEQTVTPFDIGANFIPSGHMGGFTGNIFIKDCKDSLRQDGFCIKVGFTKNGEAGWAGLYWVNTDQNWGEYPGTDFSEEGFTKVTFWARGEDGDESVKFGSGNVNVAPGGKVIKDKTKPYKDSYGKDYPSRKRESLIRLTKEWKQYTLDLKGVDFSSVIGGFYWTADWNNQGGITFYLDDILFE